MTDTRDQSEDKNLGDILVEADLLGAEQLGEALEIQLKQGKRLSEVLAEQNLITPAQLATALSIQLNMPLIDLKRHTVQPQALKLIPEELAKKYKCIPLDIVDQMLLVVMADPTDIYAVEDLQAQAKMSVEPMLGIPHEIDQAIAIHYSASEEIQKKASMITSSDLFLEDVIPDIEDYAETPITQTFDLLVEQAVKDRASDIHIEPMENRLRIRYRIDGILRDVASLPLNTHSALISRLKILSGMNIAEQRRPQDGQMSIKVGSKAIDIRAASTGTAHGERATLRILDRERTFIALDDLGFQPQAVTKYKEMLQSSFGMILVGGPTGSGKTTTLYASISRLDRDKRNIMTIEEPVEYKFTDITQVQVNPKAGITFARGLRSFMRHDPDVIMVGEIRDDETVTMAGQAALTGHLVLSSIHANDAVSTLFRLKDLGMPPYLISATLIGVVAQRMIRRICPHCRIPYEPTQEELNAYEAEMGSADITFAIGRGCNMCSNSGYMGRIGVYETMVMSDEIRQMMLSEKSAGDIRLQALKEGMITMKNDGMQKVKAEITTPSEVLRSIFSVGERK